MRPPPRHKGKVLPAGEKTVDESPSNFIFNREQVKALVDETAKLYIAGEVHYIDITGADQVSSFVRIYDPATGVFQETDETENNSEKKLDPSCHSIRNYHRYPEKQLDLFPGRRTRDQEPVHGLLRLCCVGPIEALANRFCSRTKQRHSCIAPT